MAEDLILCYHRVAAPGRDPQLLAVSPERFAAQMAILVRDFAPASLDELAAEPGRGGRVAVTFDDGYADNLFAAAPILAQYGVPATVYVVARNAATGQAFWWDEMADLLLDTDAAVLPEEIELPGGLQAEVQDATQAIRLAIPRPGAGAPYAGEADGWSVLSLSDPTPGHFTYRCLYPRLLALDPDGREKTLSRLRAILGVGSPAPSSRPLTPDEVAALDALPEMSVGAHTLRHPVLSGLAPEEQEREIEEGAAALAAMTGRRARHFSYPYGSAVHFGEETVDMVRRAGFSTAVTTIEGLAGAGSDPLRLPRVLVRDWEADVFAAHLREWKRIKERLS